MTRREVVPVGESTVDLLRPPCRGCVRWQRDPVEALAGPRRSAARQRDWVRETSRTWGPPGVILRHEDRTLAHALVAPASLVPRAAVPATAPVSDDAVLLLSLSSEGRAATRHLVQVLAREMVRRQVRAIEAYAGTPTAPGCLTAGGARRDLPWPPPDVCRVPAALLTDVGFHVLRAHPTTPLLRMDLRSTLTVVDDLRAAVRRLLPEHATAPAATLEVDGGRRG